jgi:NAD(P) transhydrogenase subunit beta
MPVVVSLLNSLSGWAAAGIGFTLSNSMLIIAGALVGSSGAILSYIMCKAMNRSLLNVLFGGFGSSSDTGSDSAEHIEKNYRSGSAEDAAFMMSNASSVVIVPGYGLAQARAQNAVKELTTALKAQGVSVRYAIHPVAGRMPGHMNVLLAEENISYDKLKEMDQINPEFGNTDVVIVLGANDVVNPLARESAGSPISGMPILDVDKARTVVVIKRSLSPGFAGIPNPLFAADNTLMLFGDGKDAMDQLVTAFKDG